MTIIRWVAITAMVAVATTNLSGQDFSQFEAEATPMTNLNSSVSQAVYASLSDIEQEAKTQTRQVAYESLRDDVAIATPEPVVNQVEQPTGPSTVYLNDVDAVQAIPVTGHETSAGTGIGQVSLFAPSCGVAGCSDPGCGISGPVCGVPAFDLGGCDSGCDAVGGCDSCETPCGALCTRQCPSCCGVGTHYSHVYAEALYLRARNAEVTYGVPVDGPIVGGPASPIQVGNFGILDPDYELGFRGGVNVALDTVSSIDVRYTLFESLTESELSTTAPFVLRSLVTHPSTASAAQDGLSAIASLEVDFDTIDVTYRHLLKCCELFSANYVIGGRYAKLEQQFDSQFVKQGIETVSTDIDFDGAGLRLGLETERHSCRNRLHVYANGYASFMAGRFRANYFQGSAFDPTVVNAEWEAGRIVPILDLEAGVGWTSLNGKLNLSAGYLVSAWFNTVTTQDYINAIQSNDYLGLSDTMTFDGLQARVSYRF